MKSLLYIISILILMSPSLVAEDGGTVSPFDLGTGARELATGGASLAMSEGAAAIYWNPAGLYRSEYISFSGLHTKLYDSDVIYQYMGLVMPTMDYGTFGISVFRLGVEGIDKRDKNNFSLGETSEDRLAFYLAYSKEIRDYQIGAALTIEHHNLDGISSTSSPGLNLALEKSFDLNSENFRSFTFAVVGRNLISPESRLIEKNIKYPLITEIGGTLEIVPNTAWLHSALLSIKIAKTDFISPKLSLGLEYSLMGSLSLRSGLRGGKPNIGMGLTYNSFSFDYALVSRKLGSLHLFTLTTSFGTPVSEKRSQREDRRENDFNTLMNDRLLSGRKAMVSSLVSQGRDAIEGGDLVNAVDLLDRALFMAKSAGLDTLEISEDFIQASERLDIVEGKVRFSHNLDSAYLRFEAKDFSGSQYFANLALKDEPDSKEAKKLLSDAKAELLNKFSEADRFNGQLALADSLLSIGQYNHSMSILTSLKDSNSENPLLLRLLNRVSLERFKEAAAEAYALNNLSIALTILDSALMISPGHRFCIDLENRIKIDIATYSDREESVEVEKQTPRESISTELQGEVDESYQVAMEQFKSGNLIKAIKHWEKVDRLAPDYKSVRNYLIKAYKFVGIEEYSQGNLQKAVDIWDKAILLDPGNKEIANYLKRTNTEISKLREFSYDNR